MKTDPKKPRDPGAPHAAGHKPGIGGRSEHDVPPKTIFMIVGVAAAGIALGMFLIMPHYGPREPRRRSGFTTQS